MTNDEIRERIKFVTMDEEDGVPGARFAREMGEEVLALRAQLALAQPLLDAAVRYAREVGGVALMPLDQLSQWEGVRAWQESAGEVEAASAAKG